MIIFVSHHILPLVVIVIVASVGLLPLSHPGLYTAHDIWHQVARLYHYNDLLSNGVFPPRWVFNLAQGYGYPLFFFSYHFPWLIGTVFITLGVSLFVTIKLLFALGFFAAGISMYALTFHLTKQKIPSLFAACVYIWSPYFFLSIYVSAALGTVFFFALVPLIVLGLFLLTKNKFVVGSLLLASSVALATLTHVLTLTLLLPLILIIWIFGFISHAKRSKYILWSGIAGLLALGLCAFYLIPLKTYLPLIAASTDSGGLTNNYTHYFASFRQLLYSPWGFGPIISQAKDGEISLQVGIAQWFGVVGSLIIIAARTLFRSNKYVKLFLSHKQIKALLLFLCLFALSIFLTTDTSQPFWLFWTKYFALDFPFRLLLMSVFTGSLVTGLVLASFKNKKIQLLIGAGLLLIALYTNRNHVRVNLYTDIPLQLYVDSETTTNTYHEYLPRTADASLLNKDRSSLLPDMPESVLLDESSSTKMLGLVEFATPTSTAIRQFGFPGIQVEVNGEVVNYDLDDRGRLLVNFPQGKSKLLVWYKKTTMVVISEYISLASVAILLLLYVLRKRIR